MLKKTIYILAFLFVVACNAPDRQPIYLDGGYSKTTKQAQEITIKWWMLFNDSELNALVEMALRDNPDINQTRKRLEAAAALARKSLSDLLPSASLSGSRENNKTDNTSSHEFSLAGAAGYELDIFGKNRAAYKKDELAAWAGAEDLRAAAITLSASVVENWLRLRSLRKEESLLKEQVKTNETILDLQQQRYESGVATALDVLQQQEILSRAKAQLPDVKADKELVMHQLAVLVGRSPSRELPIKGDTIPVTLPLPELGLPSKLLEQRPDISAAWLRVLSSDWATAAAELDRLPSFTLSAGYSTSAAAIDALFDTWLLNIAAGVAAPVIDGGNRKAEVLRQKALADEKFHAYHEIVLNAVKEVEDSLTKNHYQDEKLTAVKEQLKASNASLEQAQISYSNGDTSYINVLNGLINVQSLERQLIQAQRDLALDRVELYRSLGLSKWTDIMIKEEKNG